MLVWFLPLSFIFGLIAAPTASFQAASDAVLLWWTRVLPSLLPYLIAASLLERSGLFHRLPKRIAPIFLLFFGMLGGYPVGARLSGRLYRDGLLSQTDAQKAAATANQPNPVFLLTVIGFGLFGNGKTAIPLLLGVYGTALFGLIPLSHIRMISVPVSDRTNTWLNLPDAISDGIRAILNICGCIVFASVFGALIESTHIFYLLGAQKAFARAILMGLFEMTSGMSAVSTLPISLSVRLSLCAFFAAFGGFSVYLQSAASLPLPFTRYLLTRLFIGLAAGVFTWLLTPLFCAETILPTMASASQMLQYSFDLLLIALSSGFGLLLVFVFTFILPKQKRTP